MIRNYLEKLTLFIYAILISITLLGSIRSINFSIVNVKFTVILFTIVILLCLLFSNKIKINRLVIILFVLVTISMQIILVENIATRIGLTPNGFDPDHIFEANKHVTTYLKGYFSVYPNNISMLLMEHYILKISNLKLTWMNLAYISALFVDISAVLNVLIIKNINRNLVNTSIVINCIWILLFPMVIVPYTDTWVLPFVSGYLLLYVLIKRENKKILLFSFLMSICAIMAYFLKPSAIIPFFAIIIYELTRVIDRKFHLKKIDYLIFICCLLGGVGTYISGRHIINNQSVINIIPGRSVPIVHYVNIGMKGEGKYNFEDDMKMYSLEDKKDRVDYSVGEIKKTLKGYGVGGYLKFLILKQQLNTSDGTFGWLQEGNFITRKARSSLQQVYYPDGKYLDDYKYIAQGIWTLGIAVLFLTMFSTGKYQSVLKLSLIGGFIFLLIFEGGRSRYLIQYLPVLLTILAISWDNFLVKLNKIADFHKDKMWS